MAEYPVKSTQTLVVVCNVPVVTVFADNSHSCDIAADPLVKSLCLHSDAVFCLASDDQYILSGSKDKTVALFDRRAGKLLQKVQVYTHKLQIIE